MPEQPDTKLHKALDAPICVPDRHFPYAELDVTTNFSFLRGASHPDEMVYRAAQLGYHALAITDINSLAGVVRAYEAAKKAQMKLLIGSRLVLVDSSNILVWATNRNGYRQLCRLLTLGKRRTEKGQCQLTLDDVLHHHSDLLAAYCAAPASHVAIDDSGEASSPMPAEEAIGNLKDVFGDRLSLCIACDYTGADRDNCHGVRQLSDRFDVPVLATNHVHYHEPARRSLQDVLACVRHGCDITQAGYRLFSNGERYLKSPEQMHRLFQDWPETLHRGIEIAQRCQFCLDELRYEYPDEIVPAGTTSTGYLAHLAWAGAAQRWPEGVPDRVTEQIQHELALIGQLKYEAYFLTVYDLVRFARSRGILCQGRGSAANSAVCYCIGVTSVDPSRVDMLFERFISTARNEPPDIDIDFEHERREEVIQYVYEKYGRERSGMTAEVISYRGRSAVRDVGKALGLSADTVDQMARRLDWWHRGTVSDEQLRALGLDPADRTVRQLIWLTGQLLGFPRHLSQHVGGMVITRGPLCEMVPIENGSMPDRTVIEWDKDDIDALGILKVDLLGLGMLTCLSKALASVNENRKERLELYAIPAEDPEVYEMVSNADTVGVFQIESRAQMTMLPRLRPKCFYDLVIEVAIVRPGPIQGNMVHPYLRRRNGQEPVEYPSEALRQVLHKTLGVPLFQEQAMKIAIVGAGFSPADADRLRRAMAAWKRQGALDQFQSRFVQGMLDNGYAPDFAQRCFEQIRGFGEYGFPESHAASFALLVYASCWLKRHYPAAFSCALLNSQPMGFYAPAQIVRDAREHGVAVLPVDVNFSYWDCTLEDWPAAQRLIDPASRNNPRTWGLGSPAVRLGFRQIKGMKVTCADRLVAARRQAKTFVSVEHLQQVSALTVSTLERLAEADAFGSVPQNRRTAMWNALPLSDQETPLFSLDRAKMPDPVPALPQMPLGQEVMADYATAGLSIKCHPLGLVRSALSGQGVICAEELNRRTKGWVKVAGLVLVRQRPATASGIVFITLEDETGVANLILRPQIYEQFRAAARYASLLQAEGYIERQGQVIHILTKRLVDQSQLLAGYAFRSRDFH